MSPAWILSAVCFVAAAVLLSLLRVINKNALQGYLCVRVCVCVCVCAAVVEQVTVESFERVNVTLLTTAA